MALSDEEQRLLEQMEAALAAEDPKLVNALRGTGVRRVHRRRAAIAGVGFFAGLALLIAGISINPIPQRARLRDHGRRRRDRDLLLAARGHQCRPRHAAATAPRPRRAPGAADSQGFMDKMEERWRRRRDEGF